MDRHDRYSAEAKIKQLENTDAQQAAEMELRLVERDFILLALRGLMDRAGMALTDSALQKLAQLSADRGQPESRQAEGVQHVLRQLERIDRLAQPRSDDTTT